MSEFQMIAGFEDVWRPPAWARRRQTETQRNLGTTPDARAKLTRIVARTPEVVVKAAGRTGGFVQLGAHLNYISRNGQLDLETQDGALIVGSADVKTLAGDWVAEQLADRRTRVNSPFSHNLVLSMPAGTDPLALRDAARAFAEDLFTPRRTDALTGAHDYVFTLHTDTPSPHVHLSVCSRGHMGQRLLPGPADLELWRQVFAEKLRAHGVEAEATPRRSRGVTRKSDRLIIRRIQDDFVAGRGEMAQVRRSAYREAAKAAFQGDTALRVWERQTMERQAFVRGAYLAQARLLDVSADPLDRDLGAKLEAFLRAMPAVDTQRLALARELRGASRGALRVHDGPARDRAR